MVDVRSTLAAPVERVWAHARTMEGVNAELAPWVRMSVPAAARCRPIDDAPLGREAFVSVLFFLGIVPFDVHHLVVVEHAPAGFVEESWSWVQRRWRHERRVRAVPGGCEVHDTVTVTPRFPVIPVARSIVLILFRARHGVLRARFGSLER